MRSIAPIEIGGSLCGWKYTPIGVATKNVGGEVAKTTRREVPSSMGKI